MKINKNFLDLEANYLFSTVAKKQREYQAAHPDADVIKLSIGDFEQEEVEIIFNRDMMLNEGEVIDNISKSVGIISDETLVAQHPWVDDVQAELERLDEQKQKNMEEFGLGMMQGQNVPGADEEGQEGAGDE